MHLSLDRFVVRRISHDAKVPHRAGRAYGAAASRSSEAARDW